MRPTYATRFATPPGWRRIPPVTRALLVLVAAGYLLTLVGAGRGGLARRRAGRRPRRAGLAAPDVRLRERSRSEPFSSISFFSGSWAARWSLAGDPGGSARFLAASTLLAGGARHLRRRGRGPRADGPRADLRVDARGTLAESPLLRSLPDDEAGLRRARLRPRRLLRARGDSLAPAPPLRPRRSPGQLALRARAARRAAPARGCGTPSVAGASRSSSPDPTAQRAM